MLVILIPIAIIIVVLIIWYWPTPKKPGEHITRSATLAKQQGLRVQFNGVHAYDSDNKLYYWTIPENLDDIHGSWQMYSDQ